MSIVKIVVLLLNVFLILLIFRIVMDYVFMFARSFRPAGVMAAALELCYTVTDPPLKLTRRLVPPLRVGGISLDLGFLLLFVLVQILISVVRRFG